VENPESQAHIKDKEGQPEERDNRVEAKDVDEP